MREDDRLPPYLQAAEKLAELLGTSAEDLLDDYWSSIRTSEYPTAECLGPDELEQYVLAGKLLPEWDEHAKECKYCAASMRAATPDPELKKQFLERVPMFEVMVEAESAPDAAALESDGAHRRPRIPIPEFAFDAVSALAPAAFLLALMRSTYFRYLNEQGTGLVATWYLWPVALLVVGAVLTFALFRTRWKLPRHSIGALGGGMVTALALLVYVVPLQNQNSELALALAQRELEEVSIASLESWQSTGEFLNISEQTTRLATLIEDRSGDVRRYIMYSGAVPGEMIAELEADGVSLYWDGPTGRVDRSRIVSGTVQSQSADGFVLVTHDGEIVPVYWGAKEEEASLLLAAMAIQDLQDQRLIVILDPASSVALGITPEYDSRRE